MNVMIARGLALWVAVSGCLLNQSGYSKDPETKQVIDSIDGPGLYKAYCAVCHGLHGKGDGPMAALLKTTPVDLTQIAPNNGKFPRAAVEKIISGEEPRRSGHGPREMPVWGPIFSQIAWDLNLGEVRVYNLARFLEDMQTK